MDYKTELSEFTKAVIRIVNLVPRGRVVSYGQVAAYVGVPRAARAVGQVLRQSLDESLPWWRVVNNSGRISIKGNFYADANMQRELLRKEGINVTEVYTLSMKQYRFIASPKQLKTYGLDEIYLQMVVNKFRRGY